MSRIAVLLSSPDQLCSFTEFVDPDEIVLYNCSSYDELKRITQINRVEILLFASADLGEYEKIKEDTVIGEIPCVVFEEETEQVELTYLQANSDFHLFMDTSKQEFLACLERVERSLRKIEQLAYRDALTGCYNRRFLEILLPIEMERAHTYQTDLCIALFDIDRFKQINDTYGHVFGDIILKSFAEFLNQHKVPGHEVIRLGGEEFVVVIPDMSIEEAAGAMNRLREEINLSPITEKDDQTFFITFSGGITPWQKGIGYSDFLKQADQWMYRAKQNGRNRIESAASFQVHNDLLHQSLLISCQSPESKAKYRSYFKDQVRLLYLADTFTDTIRQLKSEPFDLIIIEDSYGKVDLNTIANIRSSCVVPILMVFPKKAPDLVDVFNTGIDDLLLHPYEEEELLYKIQYLGNKKRDLK